MAMPIYIAEDIKQEKVLEPEACAITAFIRNVLVDVDLMNIGMIAVSRLVRCFNGNNQSFLDKYKMLFVFWIWFYGSMTTLSRFIWVRCVLP